MENILTIVISKINYWAFVALMMIGLYGIILKNNLMKKIIGLSIMQTAVILFFVSIGAKKDATIPIIKHHSGPIQAHVQAAQYINPLTHVLMLTAIVVAVATLGVALALAVKIYKQYSTLEEDEILLITKEDQVSQ